MALACSIHCTLILRDNIRWVSATNRGQAAVASHNYEDAERYWKKALKRAQKFDVVDRRVSESYKHLINHYLFCDNIKAAEPLLVRYLALASANAAFDQTYVAAYQYQLAFIYACSGRLDQARTYFEKSLALSRKQHGENSMAVLSNLRGLANVYTDEERFAEADNLLKKATVISKNIAFDSHDAACLYTDMAILANRAGRYKEAIALSEKALNFAEKQHNHECRVQALYLNNMGCVLLDAEKFNEAEPFLRRALKINDSLAKTDSDPIARNLRSLARICREQKKYDEAEALARESVSIRRKILNRNNPDLAESLHELSQILLAQHRYSEAETLALEAYDVELRANGLRNTGWTDSGCVLAEIYAATGRVKLASDVLQNILAFRAKQLGATHPRTVAVQKQVDLLLNRTH